MVIRREVLVRTGKTTIVLEILLGKERDCSGYLIVFDILINIFTYFDLKV
jgi:hypothetical protein